MNVHLKAIQAGTVTRTNVIGLRKALNANWRRSRGYSVSRTAPALHGDELALTVIALENLTPLVTGELFESGLKILRSPRYKKRLAGVADIVADVQAFRLVRYDGEDGGAHAVPVYRASDSQGRSFDFRVIAWQAGGNGPELV